jgi:hypothetical protein
VPDAERYYTTETMARVPSRTTGGLATSLYRVVLLLFVLETLFDPADLILGLKLPLFVLCWATGFIVCLVQSTRLKLPLGLLLYDLLLITIPLVSIAGYLLVDGRDPYEGFFLLKAFLFISLSLLLYATRTNLLSYLCAALSVLSLAVIVVGTLVLLQPELFLPFYAFGMQYGMFSIGNRDYGGLVMFQMYFVTSPMLAISTAFYFDRAVARPERRLLYGLLTVVNLTGMILAGSRNNLMGGVLLPIALFFLHARRKLLAGIATLLVTIGAVGYFSSELAILLDPTEASNRTKLGFLDDYGRILSSPLTILFGRGLGAYEHWTGRGYTFQTEVTYLEVFRNFGLVLGSVMILLLLYPVAYAFAMRRDYPERSVILGYLLYLVMCASNPNLFGSMGMLILAILTANMAMFQVSAVDGQLDGLTWRERS